MRCGPFSEELNVLSGPFSKELNVLRLSALVELYFYSLKEILCPDQHDLFLYVQFSPAPIVIYISYSISTTNQHIMLGPHVMLGNVGTGEGVAGAQRRERMIAHCSKRH